MNTVTHAPVEQNSQAVARGKSLTPLEFFEQHARTVWQSNLTAEEKALKLRAISESIHKYLGKAQIEMASRAKNQDEWAKLAVARATAYLEELAVHLRRLAVQCQQTAGGRA